MNAPGIRGWGLGIAAVALVAAVALHAADLKVDLSKETVGKPPMTFEPMVGTWVIAQDGADKVIMIDGRPWVASKDNPTKLLIESARKLYGTSNEELMDNAKQFAYFPVAVLRGLDNFTNGTITVKFKTISGDADRASGILFNVKPNGDWLSEFATATAEAGQLTEAEIRADVIALIVAGSDTTKNSIAMTLSLLLSHPDEWRELVDRLRAWACRWHRPAVAFA